ncbi:hypothetical protein [Tabrizicola sp.]|uniref:hypothetical protein n=1 Tax=Tabrizicola sp. TaxID=2005166 RepID=UPI00286C3B06|nr:hypothetical protein [Tabrizicola sp.]
MVRGPISMVIVGAVLLAVFGLVVGGPGVLEKVLPRSAMAYLDGLGIGGVMMMGGNLASDPDATGEFASDFLSDTKDGLEARGPIAARSGNEPVFIKEVIDGYSTRVTSDIPAAITTIRPILGCALTPPLAGTIVGHATAGQSGIELAISTYNDTHLAAAVQGFVNTYRATGTISKPGSGAQAYQAYDVAVTETRAPVYLVLEGRYGTRIWNIHLAPGARIERVIMLGGAQSGVANLDPVVPVEVILGDGLAACGVEPMYPLNDGHLFFQSLENGVITQEEGAETLAKINAKTDAYDAWFLSNFGVKASDSRIGWDAGTISLIGPVPGQADPRAIWAPIENAKIRTTQDKFFEIRGQIAEGTDFASRVGAIATTFAFGDLQYLRQGVAF